MSLCENQETNQSLSASEIGALSAVEREVKEANGGTHPKFAEGSHDLQEQYESDMETLRRRREMELREADRQIALQQQRIAEELDQRRKRIEYRIGVILDQTRNTPTASQTYSEKTFRRKPIFQQEHEINGNIEDPDSMGDDFNHDPNIHTTPSGFHYRGNNRITRSQTKKESTTTYKKPRTLLSETHVRNDLQSIKRSFVGGPNADRSHSTSPIYGRSQIQQRRRQRPNTRNGYSTGNTHQKSLRSKERFSQAQAPQKEKEVPVEGVPTRQRTKVEVEGKTRDGSDANKGRGVRKVEVEQRKALESLPLEILLGPIPTSQSTQHAPSSRVFHHLHMASVEAGHDFLVFGASCPWATSFYLCGIFMLPSHLRL